MFQIEGHVAIKEQFTDELFDLTEQPADAKATGHKKFE